jgi:hypothetical protein
MGEPEKPEELTINQENRITSHKKTFVLLEEDQNTDIKVPGDELLKGRSPPKRMTSSGFNYNSKKTFDKEIQLVDSLINKTYKGPLKSFEDRIPGYKIVKGGGVECVNREELKAQEGIVMELMKTAGKTLMEGKNVIGISLPVRIFEPRSTIERICDCWGFGPIYLKRAVMTKVYLSFQSIKI